MYIQLPPVCVVKMPLPRQKAGTKENALRVLCTFYFFSLRLWPKLGPHSPQTPFSFSTPSKEAQAALQEATPSVGPFWPYSFHREAAAPLSTPSDPSSHAKRQPCLWVPSLLTGSAENAVPGRRTGPAAGGRWDRHLPRHGSLTSDPSTHQAPGPRMQKVL